MPNTSAPTYQSHFLTQHREKSVIVYTKDIALFSIEYRTTFIYTYDGKKYPLYKGMDYFESVCNPKYFYRINRQMLVHRNAITSFEAYPNRKILLHLAVPFTEKVIVSRLKVSDFKKSLSEN